MVPPEHLEMTQKFSSLTCYASYLAYSIEIVFSPHGPSVTRNGFLTFLRAEIMSDPDEAFDYFTKYNQAMRLGPPFTRSQFPQVPDPKTLALSKLVQSTVTKNINEIMGGTGGGGGGGSGGSEMDALKQQEERNKLSHMRIQLAQNQIARSAESIEMLGRIGTGMWEK
ncbi:hypothetical protein BGX27_011083 [Mortierella sp. AM989]|nr:hypothetical protein BGX27_011083 [Mortierella sp. AM989]